MLECFEVIMKKINVTFSIPEETHKMLHALIGQRKMSAFVAKILNQALVEEKQALKLAYIEAEKDKDRQEIIEDWQHLDAEDWE